MEREGKDWIEREVYVTERGNIRQRGEIFDRDGKYLIETGNIGNEIFTEEDGEL